MSKAGGWRTDGHEVWPLDDLQDHIINSDCWCDPWKTDDGIVVHVSLDRREFDEPDAVRPATDA
jgi:hypothetical protein